MNQLLFETFQHRGGKFKNHRISITGANAFGFLAGFTLRHNLQSFDYVSLSFNKKPTAVGFKFNNDPKLPGNFKLTHNKSSASVSAHSFFQVYNINVKKYQGKYEPHEHKDPKLGKLFYILLEENNSDNQRNLKKDYEK